ncbi:MAG: bifunctional phosphoribosylaminoimidazolecarboxamide formyltransferase/IMP cyclohydrolase [Bacteroides sp.]|nr:bifunctional phosphoribosylaminoimidazolecarboxamide formyltransferase/IMP cyclohydrolase [Bacteroides sp.]
MEKVIKSALISVFHKEGLDELLNVLKTHGVKVYSTGGTYDFLKAKGLDVETVESVTGYPSILGGRVKTLHPGVMGGILGRREVADDLDTMKKYRIPEIDMVVVDLYPFEETLASGASDADIIEKIDIGGISLIRAGAKNFKDVLIVPSKEHYAEAAKILAENASTTLDDRRRFAAYAFRKSSAYDKAIGSYFCMTVPGLKMEEPTGSTASKPSIGGIPAENKALRYGENPHQKGAFYGSLESCFTQLHGKEISYNNLLDIDSAMALMKDFGQQPTFAILKHNNACGLAVRPTISEAYKDALAGDPVSAFGGVLVSNTRIDLATAQEIDKIFLEVLLAPGYDEDALQALKSKKNRVLLQFKDFKMGDPLFRSCLNGVLVQDRDTVVENPSMLKPVTQKTATETEIADMLFANRIVKHSKSNAIVIAKNGQLLASGVGQTSRVDALQQAIAKARHFGFDLKGAVVASDAFFPFADCVEIAHKAGITAFIQPGGSVRDQESIDYCDKNGLAMVFTGVRHFRH